MPMSAMRYASPPRVPSLVRRVGYCLAWMMFLFEHLCQFVFSLFSLSQPRRLESSGSATENMAYFCSWQNTGVVALQMRT